MWAVMSAGAWSDQRLYRVSEAMQVLTENDLVSFGGVGLVTLVTNSPALASPDSMDDFW